MPAVKFLKQKWAWLSLLFLAVCWAETQGFGAEPPGNVTFPRPLNSYDSIEGASLWAELTSRVSKEPFNLLATILFLFAIIHTFLAPWFSHLAHRFAEEHQQKLRGEGRPLPERLPNGNRAEVSFKAEMCHFLGEVEAIFGIWVVPLLVLTAVFKGWGIARDYINHLSFTEPMFVVVIMLIAASRPVLKFAEKVMAGVAALGSGSVGAWWFSIMTVGPLLGSVITEPAAMTISAMLLREKFYDRKPSTMLAYATLGLLFVNVSVGGTLTHFAAPPVLMVAGKWGWDTPYMLLHFGWKSALGIITSNLLYFVWFRRELNTMTIAPQPKLQADSVRSDLPVPRWITCVHLLFLVWTVVHSHYPGLFIGGLLFFLAFTQATEPHQAELRLRPAFLVGFFLIGLVVHGSLQGWWIQPVLTRLGEVPLLLSAMVLTAFNDNAAITFLASQVPDFGISLKHAVVAGAVIGGGLTVIANAPNPAGQSILSRYFPDGVSAAKLFAGAAIPTALLAFIFLVFR
ncbi:MAG TPA: putative Na+/H+ antiporter [Verrucomicrobiae bacterium]|nr:putative Na+/H+ antiporter [Verrucomicrobiae bacterium]